jgi:hypothetical protein
VESDAAPQPSAAATIRKKHVRKTSSGKIDIECRTNPESSGPVPAASRQL